MPKYVGYRIDFYVHSGTKQGFYSEEFDIDVSELNKKEKEKNTRIVEQEIAKIMGLSTPVTLITFEKLSC